MPDGPKIDHKGIIAIFDLSFWVNGQLKKLDINIGITYNMHISLQF